jgi:oligosaccharyltransferase complex subunit beta
MVIDHINYASTEVEGDHTLIAGDDLIQSDVILGSKKIEVSR